MRAFVFSKILMSFLVGAFVLIAAPQNVLAEDAVHKIDFIMAHKPDNADNVKLIEDFAANVKKRTDGKVLITPVAIDNDRSRPHALAIDKLYNGGNFMSQVSVKELTPAGMSDIIDVLDMPLLFRDHDHATKVLDGNIGRDLMESVSMGSNGRIKGLAFTYSGGFRNLYSTRPVEKLTDINVLNNRSLGGRMSRDFMEHLGVKKYVASAPETKRWIQHLRDGNLEVDESETIRLSKYYRVYPEAFKYIKTVIETHHNLFLTMVAVNQAAFDSLTGEQQAIVQDEANKLAAAERALSIQQEIDGKKQFIEQGIVFVEMTEADNKAMQDAADKVHEKYKATHGRWVKAIRAVQ